MTDTLEIHVIREAQGLRFTMPRFPDWAATASGAFEIARALDQAWVEAEIAAYARRRGTVRDVTAFDDRVSHTRRATRLLRATQDDTPAPRPQLLAAIERAEADEAHEAEAARTIRTLGSVELRRAQQWTVNYDGTWLSPEGRRFRSSSDHVVRIRKILAEHSTEPLRTEHRHLRPPIDDDVTTPPVRPRHLHAVPVLQQLPMLMEA